MDRTRLLWILQAGFPCRRAPFAKLIFVRLLFVLPVESPSPRSSAKRASFLPRAFAFFHLHLRGGPKPRVDDQLSQLLLRGWLQSCSGTERFKEDFQTLLFQSFHLPASFSLSLSLSLSFVLLFRRESQRLQRNENPKRGLSRLLPATGFLRFQFTSGRGCSNFFDEICFIL